MNEVFRDVVAKHPGVVYVDAYAVFSTRRRGLHADAPGAGRQDQPGAGADGIHFTPEGGDLLATTVFDRLDPRLQGHAAGRTRCRKQTIEAKGSSSEPGTRRERR